jgi:micrococcal nuclease
MKSLIRIFGIILVIILSSCESRSGKREYQHTNKVAAVEVDGFLAVKKVVDGDTFWVDNGSPKGLKIRLIGVDAPESRKVFRKKVGFYGKEAKTYLINLLQNKRVKLVSDVDSLDRYGRTLSYVYLEDGTFINAELVKNGYAMVMTIPPNVRFVEEFVALQKEARENNKGLWAIK